VELVSPSFETCHFVWTRRSSLINGPQLFRVLVRVSGCGFWPIIIDDCFSRHYEAMEKLNAFKSKANEFAASQRGKMDSAKNKGTIPPSNPS
jgi:hypothetical protein